MSQIPLSDATNARACEDQVIAEAQEILLRRFERGEHLDRPDTVRRFVELRLACETREIFLVLFLDSRHRVIAVDPMFAGGIDGCEVHPREVVRACLAYNAAAVIFCHNHPSGRPEPSAADRAITRRLGEALALIEVRVLDHIVVGKGQSYSFAMAGVL